MRASTAVRVAMVCLLAACVSAKTQSRSDRGNDTVLSQAQLSATNSDNLFDAITKLRPEWLTSRGPTSVADPTPTSVSVFMNGSLLGKADYLQQVRILDVTEVRFWNAGQASARFGMGHPRGAIELTRK